MIQVVFFLCKSYFCGQDDECIEYGSPTAFAKAVANLEKYFAFVGIVEEMSKTLAVAEKQLPDYFAGAREIYRSQMNQTERGR